MFEFDRKLPKQGPLIIAEWYNNSIYFVGESCMV